MPFDRAALLGAGLHQNHSSRLFPSGSNQRDHGFGIRSDTMLQRLLVPQLAGRHFGINDILVYGGILIGSAVARRMIDVTGLKPA